MNRTPLVASIILHIVILIITITGMPFVKTREFIIPPAPIIVDYVEIGAVTETDNPVQTNSKVSKKESKEDAPPEMPQQSKKAETNKADDAVQPDKSAKSEDKKDEEAKEDKDKEVVDEAALPKKEDKKKDGKGKEKNKKSDGKTAVEKEKQFTSVLKNLMDEEDTEETFSGKSGINAPLGDKMTISEQDSLRGQLEKCWNVPFGAKDVESMVVEVDLVINPDRTLRSAKIADQSRYNSDNFYRAVADSALRAVKSPSCSPLNLPEDKYELWKNTTVRFNPKDMF